MSLEGSGVGPVGSIVRRGSFSPEEVHGSHVVLGDGHFSRVQVDHLCRLIESWTEQSRSFPLNNFQETQTSERGKDSERLRFNIDYFY